MSDLPDDPDELKAYIEQLLDELQWKDQELDKAHREILQLKQKTDPKGQPRVAELIEDIENEIKQFQEKFERDLDKLARGEDTERIKSELEEWRQYEEQKKQESDEE